MYILKIKITLEMVHQFAQAPVERPQVVNADVVSKIACTKLSPGSTIAIRIQEDIMRHTDIINMELALSTKVKGMVLRSNSICCLPCKVVIIDLKITNNVVVLIPPAVEQGDPPINMITMINKMEACDIFSRSKTVNPEVLLVSIWQTEANILSKSVFCVASERSCSTKKKKIEPKMMMANDVIKTIFV